MVCSIGLIIILSIAGPVLKERSSRNDKLITSSIYGLSDTIRNYTNTNSKLPDSLSVLDVIDNNTKQAIDKNLIEYKPNTLAPTKIKYSGYSTSTTSQDSTFYYQLCVNYVAATSYNGSYSSVDTSPGSYAANYSYDISAYDHPAGHVCYNVKTSY